MGRSARLVDTRVPSAPDGLVLVLHGGATRQDDPVVTPTQLSVVRMIPIARRIARLGHGRLGVFRLLNSYRGWHQTHTPVMDVRWALERLEQRFGAGVPVCLVGHSLGGRAALLAGAEHAVTTVVALNPWVYATDDVDLTGRRVLIVHGSDDRLASPARAAAVAQRLARNAEVDFLTIEGGQHAMLRHAGKFERAACDFAISALLGGSRRAPHVDPAAS